MRGGLDAFRALGFAPREIRITGGGSKSRIWRQMAADIMNVPVKRPANSEAAAMGGALQALWCLFKEQGKPAPIAALCAGHISIREDECAMPNPQSAAAYEQAYTEYQKYLKTLTPLFR
jgi:xylulokinase